MVSVPVEMSLHRPFSNFPSSLFYYGYASTSWPLFSPCSMWPTLFHVAYLVDPSWWKALDSHTPLLYQGAYHRYITWNRAVTVGLLYLTSSKTPGKVFEFSKLIHYKLFFNKYKMWRNYKFHGIHDRHFFSDRVPMHFKIRKNIRGPYKIRTSF